MASTKKLNPYLDKYLIACMDLYFLCMCGEMLLLFYIWPLIATSHRAYHEWILQMSEEIFPRTDIPVVPRLCIPKRHSYTVLRVMTLSQVGLVYMQEQE